MGTSGDDLEKLLSDDERAVYAQAARTRQAIQNVLGALGPRDVRTRAVWRAAEDEAAGIQLVLEWEALKREAERRAAQPEKPVPTRADDAREDDPGEPGPHGD